MITFLRAMEIHFSRNLPLLTMSLAVFSSQPLSLQAASSSLPHCSLLLVACPAAWPPPGLSVPLAEGDHTCRTDPSP